jgi:cobalt-zinc-cadmium efflux system membrane fusion protein
MNAIPWFTCRALGLARASIAAAVVLALAVTGCGKPRPAAHDEHGHAEGGETHVERGPHGGRLFEAEGVRVELSIFEDGTPPEYRAHVSDTEGRPLPTGELAL